MRELCPVLLECTLMCTLMNAFDANLSNQSESYTQLVKVRWTVANIGESSVDVRQWRKSDLRNSYW